MSGLSNRLLEIVARRRVDVEAAMAGKTLAELERAAAAMPPARGFIQALKDARPFAVIAEVKRASPSQGAIKAEADAVDVARRYETAGAAALSVLTEPHYFGGSLQDMIDVRAQVELPVLRKDFTIGRWQIAEARAAGADAVLLMVSVLGQETAPLLAYAHSLGLDALVEIHDRAELEVAAAAGASLIGVNNRDLRDLSINLATTEALTPFAPKHAFLVGESGIENAADLNRMARAGCRAVLVGSALMRQADPGAALTALLAGAVDGSA
ncbi:MAG: indole-3-glycerol phosphate synthase TrpC [Elsteraceae bacterium]